MEVIKTDSGQILSLRFTLLICDIKRISQEFFKLIITDLLEITQVSK